MRSRSPLDPPARPALLRLRHAPPCSTDSAAGAVQRAAPGACDAPPLSHRALEVRAPRSVASIFRPRCRRVAAVHRDGAAEQVESTPIGGATTVPPHCARVAPRWPHRRDPDRRLRPRMAGVSIDTPSPTAVNARGREEGSTPHMTTQPDRRCSDSGSHRGPSRGSPPWTSSTIRTASSPTPRSIPRTPRSPTRWPPTPRSSRRPRRSASSARTRASCGRWRHSASSAPSRSRRSPCRSR